MEKWVFVMIVTLSLPPTSLQLNQSSSAQCDTGEQLGWRNHVVSHLHKKMRVTRYLKRKRLELNTR